MTQQFEIQQFATADPDVPSPRRKAPYLDSVIGMKIMRLEAFQHICEDLEARDDVDRVMEGLEVDDTKGSQGGDYAFRMGKAALLYYGTDVALVNSARIAPDEALRNLGRLSDPVNFIIVHASDVNGALTEQLPSHHNEMTTRLRELSVPVANLAIEPTELATS